MEERLVALLADLVAIPSPYPPGETSRIADFCADLLSREKFSVEKLHRKKGVQNVVARLGKGKPSIVFNAHADTVDVGDAAAWTSDPFRATLRDGRIYGLGACNCKASMAVHLWLAGEIARRGGPKRGEVVFTFVGDEENLGSEGLAWLREAGHVKPDSLIVAAPTRNRIVYEERGVMWVRITTRGRAAHAGAPHTGESAILRMQRIISSLGRNLEERKSASGQQATLSIGTIRGGENINVVPDACTIQVDRRLLPEEDFGGAFRELESAARAAGAHEVELLTGTPGFSMPETGPAASAFGAAVREVTGKPPERLNVVGASDGRYFARDGIEILVTGPGDGADSHIPNESVPLDELEQAARIHLAAAARLFSL